MEENKIITLEETQKKVTLYDCAKLFIETMDEKFPDTCEDSAIFLIATDGNKVSGMFNGTEDFVRDMIAYYLVQDKDLRDIVRDALIAAIQHVNKNKR